MKNVYFFGDGHAQGNGGQKDLLGGKGANLAEMTNLGIPVPPGFTIITDVCTKYLETGNSPHELKSQINISLQNVGKI